MNLLTIAIILSIVLAFVFTFLNGMNDAANSISTIIASFVLGVRRLYHHPTGARQDLRRG